MAVLKLRAKQLFVVLGKGALALAALPLLYLFAALIGGLIPANPGWHPPTRGIRIFIETNGVHTWIVVPKVTRYMDWRPFSPVDHLRDPSQAGNYLAIGYGNREFYLNTPAWEDLTLARAFGAAFGTGTSLVHVYHERDPRPGETHRPLLLTPAQYRRLSAYIARSFERGPDGRTRPLIGRGYGNTDIFYEARGGYNGFYTCNEWTGAALRQAGVRLGIWTPFSQSIVARFASDPG